MGSGAMFFALAPKRAVLADLNNNLIDCYRAVRNNPKGVSGYLDRFSSYHSLAFYLSSREAYNSTENKIYKAALFIYLNKAAFNAIYRVNRRGEFNVPFAHNKRLILPTTSQLLDISGLLKSAKLRKASFDKITGDVNKGAFVYLDPPYPPINGTSYFTHYTKERFCLNDQERVSKVAKILDKKGCLVMISNTDLPLIRKLYKDWNIYVLPVTRWLTCKSTKHKIFDLIISNYDVRGI